MEDIPYLLMEKRRLEEGMEKRREEEEKSGRKEEECSNGGATMSPTRFVPLF